MKTRKKELFRYYPAEQNDLPENPNSGLYSFKSDVYDQGAIVCFCDSETSLIKSDLASAFPKIETTNEITIREKDSPLITQIDRFYDIPLPEHITSVNLTLDSYANPDNYINFIKKLPNNVQLCLNFDPNLSLENIKKILSSIPEHVTNIKIPDLFNRCEDNDEENKKLAQIFGHFGPKVTEINMVESPSYDDTQKAVSDSRLKKVLLHLPFSVTKLTVQGKPAEVDITAVTTYPPKIVHMQTFRDKNYFPNYDRVINSPTEAVPQTKGNEDPLFAKAKRILNDYSKHDSVCPPLALFFSGRWNLHHVDRVNQALDTSKTFEALYNTIKRIELDNPNGSLARRIRYIQSLPEFKERFPEEIQQSNPLKIK